VEETNKLLLHVLKCKCAPNLGEDNTQNTSWDKLPRSWPEHLDNTVNALNNHLLTALKFSPKELLLGLVANTLCTSLKENSSILHPMGALSHITYVEQQQLGGYDETIWHAIKCKAAFDKKLLQQASGEVIFEQGQLIHVYQSDLNYTFRTDHKILPKWSVPRQIQNCILNFYTLKMLEGTLLQGEYSVR
jgi:hypothetical protein